MAPAFETDFFLEPSDNLEARVCLLPVSRARAYVLLLQQAYTLSLDIHQEYMPLVERPKDNRQQMVEYLRLASQVSVLRLQYPRKFGALNDVFSLIENDLFESTFASLIHSQSIAPEITNARTSPG